MIRLLAATACVLVGCSTTRQHLVDHGGRPEAPAVVPLIHDAREGEHARIVGSGVPAGGQRVFTALHVIQRGFPIRTPEECGRVHAIGGFDASSVADNAPDADDIAWIETHCEHQQTGTLSASVPPPGTPIVISGYPIGQFAKHDFLTSGIPEPVTLRGHVIDPPTDLPEIDTRCIWVELPDVNASSMHGFSGGPCAYQDQDNNWVVFGIAQYRLGQEYWSLLGHELPIRPRGKKVIIGIAPFPSQWLSDQP